MRIFRKKSLVFLDPDIGLEESNPDQRHLLFNEVKMIYDPLDTDSIMLIYQHFPWNIHEDYLMQRCSQLSKHPGSSPLTITDNEIIIFLCAKNPGIQENLELALEKDANSYQVVSFRTCG